MHMLKWFVGALALLALACGEVSETSTPVVRDGEGLLELPLVSTSAGRTYRLVGATFDITGPQNATITDTTAETVLLPLMAGTYTLQMNGDWHVERTDAPGVTVPVTLVSPNPMSFTLTEGETRPVRFLFKVPGDGTVDVGIGVDTGGWISGTIHFDSRPPPPPGSPPDVFADVGGRQIPYVISYESATVTRTLDYGSYLTTIQTSPVTVQFGGATGAAFQQQVVSALQGRTLTFSISSDGSPTTYVSALIVENMERGVRFELMLNTPLASGVDANGYAILRPTDFTGGFAELRAANSGSVNGLMLSGTLAPR
ncbi:hypothetical protein [Corallococcus sp. AS-1-6]|uniref:hypothetical protein n=1 Tax=Corallococcus sp. AS-1-6 TaxID=2874599 RepID=UPI001CBD934D|nr:hypothetical protein [Corallococcus sp. AS-1-6]MBZ4373669.1 hypothetical protein [Corallococcus sp. AS-1-6]